MESTIPIVDVWMQHPSRQFRELPMFETLRRWTRHETPYTNMPLEATLSAMDEAGVQVGLLSAWWGPHAPLIGNKVLFGSNYPMLTRRECLQDLAMLALDEETTRLFLAENAARVFALR